MPQYVSCAPEEQQQLSFSMDSFSVYSSRPSHSPGINDHPMQTDNMSSYGSISGSNREDLDMHNGAQPVMGGKSFQTLARGSNPLPFPLAQFYSEQNGPWNHFQQANGSSSSVALDGHQSAELFGVELRDDFGHYRNNTAASDCDTLAFQTSDSGYGSMPKKSTGIPSVYGDSDRSLETQSLAGGMAELFRQPPVRNASQPLGVDENLIAFARQAADNHSTYKCSHCHKMLKTRSELTKHDNKHAKPYTCDVPDCRRKGRGFSSQNDLSRHKQSVHRAPGVKYRCPIGPCRAKGKHWPRLDNFKSHLLRMHGRELGSDDDLKDYLITEPDSFDGFSQLKTTSPAEALELTCLGAATATDSVDYISPNRFDLRLSSSPPLGHWFESEKQQPDPIMALCAISEGAPSPGQAMLSSLVAIPSDAPLDQGRTPETAHEVQMPPGDELCMPAETGGTFLLTNSPTGRELSLSGESGLRPDTVQGDQIHQSLVEDPAREVPDYGGSNSSSSLRGDDPVEDSEAPAESEKFAYRTPEAAATTATAKCCHRDTSAAENRLAEARDISPETPVEECSSRSDRAEINDSIEAPKTYQPSVFLDTQNEVSCDDELQTLLESLEKKGMLPKLMEKLRHQKVQEPLHNPSETAEAQTPSGDCPIPCTHPACRKVFLRKCELRKHMKRHEKPYGCTYPQCRKRFGSKNDWKRHENSQHYQLELWRCGEKTKERDEVCDRVCHRRESFKAHLQKDHDVKDSESIEKLCSQCHIGRNYEARFWCGFCEKTIEIKEQGARAWDERFNHIGGHYMGDERKDIAEWKNIYPDQEDDAVFESITGSDDGGRNEAPVPGEAARLVLMSNSKRRTSHDVEQGMRPKRVKTDDPSMWLWYCCHCGDSLNLASTNVCLVPECSHPYCDNCPRECCDPTENHVQIQE